ncbi:hypothetical protein SAMN05444166_4374 [Singulisphaera sp. GP187]|uniref:hypothetical protein n=1 Tax=Singulisphaera sp. GP187 TaxID=1882752 RepID=UPI00092C45CA|nr:hypothetical protein [Singulisphaera sp. GP187]SIO39882.1 hypothetical protein SAMN05444166_4374 [Singulisphaera sp. GP187]
MYRAVGPIPLKWGVSAWPTVYLVDAKGVIRSENLRGPARDKAVEARVIEAESVAPKRRSIKGAGEDMLTRLGMSCIRNRLRTIAPPRVLFQAIAILYVCIVD